MMHFLTRSFVAAALLFKVSAIAADAFIEKQDLFLVGDNPEYKVYHIPGIVVTAKGSVLAWCEARKGHKVSDWDDIRILLRRSTDDGRTWSAPRILAEVENPKPKNPFALRMKGVDLNDVTYNNPVLIADRDGTVHGLFCVEYMRCFYIRSTDDGVTWSKPVEISSAFEGFKKAYDWKVCATGPDHSIQLKNGRLVVPVWLSPAPAAMHIVPVSPQRSAATIPAGRGTQVKSPCPAPRSGSIRTKPSPSNSPTAA